MRITRVEVWSVSIPLNEPYTVAYAHTEAAINVFLRLHTDAGLVGLGSANPDPEVTGETPELVERLLSGAAREELVGADPLARTHVLPRVAAALGKAPATLAAVDMALFDLLGKVAGLPVYQLLGGHRTRVRTATTIGIEPELQAVAHAKDWVARGFTLLKIKGGLDVAADVARVRKIREEVGESIDLVFDANQGFTYTDAVRFARETAGVRLHFMEQPSAKEDLELLGQIRHAIDLPVMADECMCSAEDAFRLAAKDLATWINLKLMKVGGITPALAIDAVARAGGLKVMVGCMDESALSIAAGLHVALASPTIEVTDLDGHLALVGDPAAEAIPLVDGYLHAPQGPGLGIVLP
jgi:L-alanine-DL-glutamate epimerase-like enolase superfamily enzyme